MSGLWINLDIGHEFDIIEISIKWKFAASCVYLLHHFTWICWVAEPWKIVGNFLGGFMEFGGTQIFWRICWFLTQNLAPFYRYWNNGKILNFNIFPRFSETSNDTRFWKVFAKTQKSIISRRALMNFADFGNQEFLEIIKVLPIIVDF